MTHEPNLDLTRRHFFSRSASGLGIAALSNLMANDLGAADGQDGLPRAPHFAPRAKRVIYLFQSGGPAQLDLFDPKPGLLERQGTELPDSIRGSQRLTGMTAAQASFPVAPSKFSFSRHGESGQQFSELLPHTASIADKIAVVRSMHTEQINHDPAITFLQTGHQLAGRPSLGSWLSYGLGSESSSLPAFVVMVSQGSGGQPLYSRLWGSGFLPTRHQAVKFRAGREPVLYLNDPEGFSREDRRQYLDGLSALNRVRFDEFGDPEIENRIAQYEMAYRMQASVPELTDLSSEPEGVFELYGKDSRKPGSFASNCLLARRLVERGVRCVQLFHRGWGPSRQPSLPVVSEMLRDGPGLGGVGQGSRAARTAGGHAGGVGRRIRTDGVLPRQAHRRDLRTRPPPAVLLHLAGRGRNPRRRDSRRNR